MMVFWIVRVPFIFLFSLVVCESQVQIVESNKSVILKELPTGSTAMREALLLHHEALNTHGRSLAVAEKSISCDPSAKNNLNYKRYFDGMEKIYKLDAPNTCLQSHIECGWPAVIQTAPKLPLLVLSVGLEGAGHHLWTEILDEPIFDCVWTNARHYRRDIGDGVARTTSEELQEGSNIYQL